MAQTDSGLPPRLVGQTFVNLIKGSEEVFHQGMREEEEENKN